MTNNTLSSHIREYNTTTISNWSLFNNNEKEFARKDWNSLLQIEKLNDQAKTEILKFSDASNAKSTLKEFTADMNQVKGFTDFVNKNIDFTKGFLGHKQKPIFEDTQYEYLSPEKITEIPTGSELFQNIKAWLRYSEDQAKRQNNFEKGTAFEKYIEGQLKDSLSATYLHLKEKFGKDQDGTYDLDHRSIYRQVKFCINKKSVCNDAGEYFIADFVFVREIKNPITGEVLSLNVKIADSKLSPETDFTDNQKVATSLNNFTIKSISDKSHLKGNEIKTFVSGNDVKKQVTY